MLFYHFCRLPDTCISYGGETIYVVCLLTCLHKTSVVKNNQRLARLSPITVWAYFHSGNNDKDLNAKSD